MAADASRGTLTALSRCLALPIRAHVHVAMRDAMTLHRRHQPRTGMKPL